MVKLQLSGFYCSRYQRGHHVRIQVEVCTIWQFGASGLEPCFQACRADEHEPATKCEPQARDVARLRSAPPGCNQAPRVMMTALLDTSPR